MSVIKFQHLIQQIKDKLFEIAYKIKCFNKSGDNDICRYAESYFLKLINIIFKAKNWEFEKASKINQDTYDLYDIQNKICIQITSNISKAKKDKTILNFTKKYEHKEFNKLIIVYISEKKPKANNINLTEYEDYNIIEFSNLFETYCNLQQLLEARDILVPNLLPNIGTKNEPIENKIVRIEHAEAEFIRCIQLEKELKRELLIPEYGNEFDFIVLNKDPFKKFNSMRFILRSIEEDEYPNVTDSSKWERTFFYDFYDKGILTWIGATRGVTARVNENGNWYIEPYESKEKPFQKGFELKKIRIIGKIPYSNIVHWKQGDDYYSDYQLFCKYLGIDESPYVEIEYRYDDSEGRYWENLELEKRIELVET